MKSFFALILILVAAMPAFAWPHQRVVVQRQRVVRQRVVVQQVVQPVVVQQQVYAQPVVLQQAVYGSYGQQLQVVAPVHGCQALFVK